MPAVTGYYLRGIPPEMWRGVKTRAAFEGRTIRFVILALLRLYAKHGLDAIAGAMKERHP